MTDERVGRSIRRVRHCLTRAGTAAGLLLGSSLASAQPCPCPVAALRDSVEKADVIFVGKSLSATTDSTGATTNSEGTWIGGAEFQTRLMFDVQTIIKGDPPRFVEVVTPTGPCGVVFAVGETYLVVGTGKGTAVTTDSCRGNVSGLDAIDARAAAIRKILEPAPIPRKTHEQH